MIDIKADIHSKVGFAAYQNAIPLLTGLRIDNSRDEPVGPATLILAANPGFITHRVWRIEQLAARSSTAINDLRVEFNAGMLAELSEAVRAELRFVLDVAGTEVATARLDVDCLPRYHWGGVGGSLGLLAAFCMPNDPAIDRLLRSASDTLRVAGQADALNGYDRAPKDVWGLAAAIWTAIARLDVRYALPPASFEVEGQKIRAPSMLLDGRVATCLDTTLLFAACLEQAGLYPIIVLTKNHAFCGVWLRKCTLPELVAGEAEILRKHVALNDLVVFETTLATQQPPARFAQAIDRATRALDEAQDGQFFAALDVRRARMMGIRPMGGEGLIARAQPEIGEIEHRLELPPDDFVPPPVEIEPPVPDTPEGRLAHWQRKLLDLTTRNRLLHVSDRAKMVRPFCYDLVQLEAKLADGAKIGFTPLSDIRLSGRDEQLYQAQNQENLREQSARRLFDERSMLLCDIDKGALDAQLIDLYRTARTDMQEGGANTLFLALGFLKWRKSADDARVYHAPLVLLPVRLERKSALSGVVMSAHEDEPCFNLTLLELLRHDFNLAIPGLSGPLPALADHHGVDVRGILTRMRLAVRDMPGFEVVETTMLGSFSFAKYLMWRDMADRAAMLSQSPVVKLLIERGQNRYQSGGEYPRESELDRTIDPAELFLPLPADSSQIAAVVASARDCDFVLVSGP